MSLLSKILGIDEEPEEQPVFDEAAFKDTLLSVATETEKRLKKFFPNKKTIKVKLTSHKRDFKKQEEYLQSGSTKSSISLHNFGAAGDFLITMDGKTYDATGSGPLGILEPYQILGGVAEDKGLFWGWKDDSGHVASTRFVDQFLTKYPDMMKNNKGLLNWYEHNNKTTQRGYKFVMDILDSFYQRKNVDRVYKGDERTIDPLMTSIVPEKNVNEQVFDLIK